MVPQQELARIATIGVSSRRVTAASAEQNTPFELMARAPTEAQPPVGVHRRLAVFLAGAHDDLAAEILVVIG
jgi:hypothetical protein